MYLRGPEFRAHIYLNIPLPHNLYRAFTLPILAFDFRPIFKQNTNHIKLSLPCRPMQESPSTTSSKLVE